MPRASRRHPKPYILSVHGSLSSASDWQHQPKSFGNAGYGIVAPDLPGCGSSDEHEDSTEHASKKVCESVDVVVSRVTSRDTMVLGGGHDRPALSFHPERSLSYSLLAVSYWRSGPCDLDPTNATPEAAIDRHRPQPSHADEASAMLKDSFEGSCGVRGNGTVARHG
ncbi:MAG: hypothetical protein M1832_004216 [Thelocarpon impressellum]|nr:MAG: hypothetical protein M1832_004216 [Thelocarpon impressellum]